MNWERAQTVMHRHVKNLGAKRVWLQQFGANNGFGLAADWGDGNKASVMISRSLPDSMSDSELDNAIADATKRLGEKVSP